MSHSILSPSSAKQWTECTRSPSFIKEQKEAGNIPEETTSSYADLGTCAHDIASEILLGNMELDDIDFDSRVLENEYDAAEMVEAVGSYVELAQRLKEEGDQVFVETRIPLFYRKFDHGTVDYALIGPDRMYILDLKYGVGVEVEAKDNKQLATYARSFIEHHEEVEGMKFPDDYLVTIAIHQPRTMRGTPTRVWAINKKDLFEFTEHMNVIAKQIDKGENLVFSPGDEVCQWCDVKGICKARQQWASDPLAKHNIDILDALDDEKLDVDAFIAALSDADIANIINIRKPLMKFMEDVEKAMYARLDSGYQSQHLKLVDGGLGNRAWEDEEAADKLLKGKLKIDDRYTKKLISPTQAEKLLKGVELSPRFQNKLDALITRKVGAPKMVPVGDERPAINLKVEEVFSDMEEDSMLD